MASTIRVGADLLTLIKDILDSLEDRVRHDLGRYRRAAHHRLCDDVERDVPRRRPKSARLTFAISVDPEVPETVENRTNTRLMQILQELLSKRQVHVVRQRRAANLEVRRATLRRTPRHVHRVSRSRIRDRNSSPTSTT